MPTFIHGGSSSSLKGNKKTFLVSPNKSVKKGDFLKNNTSEFHVISNQRLNTSCTETKLELISGNKFLMCYNDSSNKFNARVITYGEKPTIGSLVELDSTAKNINIIPLDSTRALILYSLNNILKGVFFNIQTSVVVSKVDVFNATNNTTVAVKVSTNKIAVVYVNAYGEGVIRILTINGNAITSTNETKFDDSVKQTTLVRLSDTRVMAFYMDLNNRSVALLIDVASNPTVIHKLVYSEMRATNQSAVKMTEGKVIICARSTNVGVATLLSYTDKAMTNESSTVLEHSVAEHISCTKMDDTRVLVGYRVDNTICKINVVSIKGNKIVAEISKQLVTDNEGFVNVVAYNENEALGCYTDNIKLGNVVTINSWSFVEKTVSNDIVGIANQDGSSRQPIEVIVP